LLDILSKQQLGRIYLGKKGESSWGFRFNLLHASQCYACREIALWVDDSIIYPPVQLPVLPNVDLPDDVKHDFDEARSIVDLSPRGAAALLRLGIQKLCVHLGESGKNIDKDIKSLVSKGLNPLIQKSLDIVRVVGNEAVHPGSIDLNDDRPLAIQLFTLVNSIAEQMISHPRSVNETYLKLPKDKRDGIEARDKK